MTQEEFNNAYYMGMAAAWVVACKTEDLRRKGKFADCYGVDKSLWDIPAETALAMMMEYEEKILYQEERNV